MPSSSLRPQEHGPRRMRSRAAISAVAAAALILGLAASSVLPVVRADDADARLADIVSSMEAADQPAQVFALSRDLDALGTEGLEPARKRIADPAVSPRAKLGLARYLLANREKAAAFPALVEIVKNGDDPEAARMAADMIGLHASTKDDVKGLKAAVDRVADPMVKIAALKVLRDKGREASAERQVKEFLSSDDWDVRAAAALALGELGNVQAAKHVLAELKLEPTERGKRAAALLYQEELIEAQKKFAGLEKDEAIQFQEKKIKELEEELKKAKKQAADAGASGLSPEFQLLDELLRNIRTYYVEDGEKTDTKTLVDEAAKGMVSSLDPFSSYMTEKETKEFKETMDGKYAGIGAVVSMDPKDKVLTIIRPIYSGPAYKKGLRSLDKIIEVEGESTFGKTVEELVAKLKGEAGTDVKIKVYRRGWQKEKEFTLTRAEIQLQSVHYAMLPGKIGYVSLSQFGQTAVEEVEGALKELEAQGMRSLVFDLRANPGGLLSAAVEIADKFLKDDRLIVYSEGRNKAIAPRRDFKTKDDFTHPDYPVVVLVNKASASASEIVAGALQDHKRATLVGETTFGKGSVQQLMQVKATGEKSTLRLTIAKYYLPSGRSIHRDEKTGKGGVEPDIVTEADTDPAWLIQEVDRLLELKSAEVEPGGETISQVDAYVRGIWREHKELALKLAMFDDFDESRYPGFDEWFKSLQTKLEPDQVRKVVRNQLRRLAQDDQGKEFALDLEDDIQLQRGVYEVLRKLGDDPARYEEYAYFAVKFAPKAVEKPAEAPPGAPHAREPKEPQVR